MPASLIAALCCTVALLVVTAYFFMGALPLLILKHDTPLDARFVRGFLDTYCRATIVTAAATAASYALAGKAVFAAGAAAIALVAVALRRKLIPKMDALRSRIDADAAAAVSSFRRLHMAAIAMNFAQLALVVGGLIALSMQTP